MSDPLRESVDELLSAIPADIAEYEWVMEARSLLLDLLEARDNAEETYRQRILKRIDEMLC